MPASQGIGLAVCEAINNNGCLGVDNRRSGDEAGYQRNYRRNHSI